MAEKKTVCLLNDSFPPLIDGVSNVVVNYARYVEKNHGHAMVVTPKVPGADDSGYEFPVLRFPSIDTRQMMGYVTGVPYSPEIVRRIRDEKTDLLHLHCPMSSALLAKQVKDTLNLPLILTWHTKYDIDVRNAIHSKMLADEAIRILIQNVNACDEVWTVSRGAGENLRSLGYEGDYIVMENGVDIPRGKVSRELEQTVCGGYDLPEGMPVFLFVGRLMWYKGLRLILDAMAAMKEEGRECRMVFVGGGGEEAEIKAYCEKLKLTDRCIFTGAVRDREALRAWYGRADLFLFPSTFDTNGLVVREAAACGTASVLIEGSCAAEDVTDGRNGFLIEENWESLAAKLREVCEHPEAMERVGRTAQAELYLSWEDAVARAVERYDVVLDRFRSGAYKKKTAFLDFAQAQGKLMNVLMQVQDYQQRWLEGIRSDGQEMLSNLASERDMILESFRFDSDELRDRMSAVIDLVAGTNFRKDDNGDREG